MIPFSDHCDRKDRSKAIPWCEPIMTLNCIQWILATKVSCLHEHKNAAVIFITMCCNTGGWKMLDPMQNTKAHWAAVHCYEIQCSEEQYSTVQHSAVKCSAVQCSVQVLVDQQLRLTFSWATLGTYTYSLWCSCWFWLSVNWIWMLWLWFVLQGLQLLDLTKYGMQCILCNMHVLFYAYALCSASRLCTE